MGVYLEKHPPARSQFRTQRRAVATGAIVVHTAENATDVDLPDDGAEAVAGFISRRTDAAGSYHSIVDSDSIVRVGRYEWEMFHEGTGGNRWSLGLSFACGAAQWPSLPSAWVDGSLYNGAQEAASMARWVRETVGVAVPALRITAEQYRAGEPGFIGHGDLDPARRSDPGDRFPWSDFLERFGVEMADGELEIIQGGIMLWTLDDAMLELSSLYLAYTGVGPSAQDRSVWGRELARVIYEAGEDPVETLKYVQWVLAAQYAKTDRG